MTLDSIDSDLSFGTSFVYLITITVFGKEYRTLTPTKLVPRGVM